MATTGNDETGDGTVSAPYATIGRAMTDVNAGTTVGFVEVEAGTYTETITIGRTNLTIKTSGAVVIDGETSRKGFDNSGGYDDITLKGSFEFVNCTVGIDNRGDNFEISDGVEVHACSSYGIYLIGCDSPVLNNPECYGCGATSIYFHQNVTNGQIVSPYTHDNSGVYGIEIDGGSDNNVVTDGWSYNNKAGFISKLSTGNQFYNCVAWNNTGYQGFYAKGAPQTEFVNCDAYLNGYGFYLGNNTPGDDTPSTDCIVKNCISDGNTTAGFWIAAESESGLSSDYNDGYNDALFGIWGGVNQSALADWQSASSQDANSQAVDPNYDATTYGNFTPQAAAVLTGADDSGPQGHTG